LSSDECATTLIALVPPIKRSIRDAASHQTVDSTPAVFPKVD